MNGCQVWICGRLIPPAGGWHFQGVFATEAEAVAACRDEYYFIGPAMIGEHLPHDAVEWTGGYFPELRGKTSL